MDLLFKGVCLSHDNTCSHSVATTAETIRQLEFGLPHLLVGRPSSNELSCVWTTTWSLAWTKSGQWWQRTWCIQGFDHNWKLPLQMVSKGLQTATQYALKEKKGDYTDKWCTLHLSQTVVQEVSNTITLPFDSTSQLQIFFVACLEMKLSLFGY